MTLTEYCTGIADAIREKEGSTEAIPAPEHAARILALSSGGGGSEEEWIGDGNTHIWITLQEGRTSPRVGLGGLDGTVTIDWGDGSEPDVLTGTSILGYKYTPAHEYVKPGDYVITLSGGEVNICSYGGYTSRLICATTNPSDNANIVYASAVKMVEVGSGHTIGQDAFNKCYSLTSVHLPDGVTSIAQMAFYECRSLTSVNIPDCVTSIGNSAFCKCSSLTSVHIPDGVTSIGTGVFEECGSLTSVNIPDGVTTIGEKLFYSCRSLTSVNIPDGVTSIGGSAFSSCYSLTSVNIPDGVTSIGNYAFYECRALTGVNLPDGVTSIGENSFRFCSRFTRANIPAGVTKIQQYTFGECYGVICFDFSQHTAVPALANKNAFTSIASDCQIRVPAALVDQWKAATNWSTYADKIVGV